MVSSASFEFEFCDVFAKWCRESVVYTKSKKKGETGSILMEPDMFTFQYCINKVNFLNKFHYLGANNNIDNNSK